ncbi:MAG: hypothetical protein WCL61_01720, partial [bacterium]
IYISDNQIMFSFNNIDLISRLIDGMYPEYEQIIPPAFKNKVTINRQALIKAVKTSSLFTKNSVCDVKLEFLKEKNEIIVTSSSAQTGENSDDLEAQIEGESLLVVFNYNYLLDGLNNINGDEVVMEMNSPSAPILLRAKELNDYLYIVMPIKQEATA